ncbi:hypothetical protein [Lacticaseibacillus hulanensis]|uniref:hypothetical protein n=1 Tax=Lacticaseibacillus hulanensis TaxID=2493111 RepID=UPI000FD9B3CF|nr:hypothetical protein [Lacticaseibacillus hulanensis]
MLRYHFLRDNLDHEEAFLSRQAARGYVLTRIRGARYKFAAHVDRDGKPYHAYLRFTKERYDAANAADQVVTMQLSRELYYNVLYMRGKQQPKLQSNPDAVDQFHVYMLDYGAKQEWKGGLGLFAGLMLFTAQAAWGHAGGLLGSWPVRALLIAGSVALVAASVWGLFIGFRNSINSVHPRQAPTDAKRA